MIDLYTFPTPNGQKITIALEELGLPYRLHRVDITRGDQAAPDFLAVNPNGKIPAIVDDGVAIFESVAILIHLAEKTGRLLPASGRGRSAVLSWSLWQASGLGPMMGQYGHFAVFAPEKIPYAVTRYDKEARRLLGVLDRQLAAHLHLAGDDYSIADIATWPWLACWTGFYKAGLDEAEFPNVVRWFRDVGGRPAVQRGMAADVR